MTSTPILISTSVQCAVIPWPSRIESAQILSLYELMFEYAIDELVMAVSGLLAARVILAEDTKDALAPADPNYLKNVVKMLNRLYHLGKAMGLDSSLLAHIDSLYNEINVEDCQIPAVTIRTKLDCISDGIQENLNSRKFMFIPSDQFYYWGNATIFGDDFSNEFPEAARFEALEVGNCFAAGRWTASVFHSMRVAEYGLRKLAKSLKVNIIDRGKNCPLEYGDWHTVITAIRGKIADARKLPAGPKKTEALRRYSDAADHCEYMKDIWRNEISHTRRAYSKAECLGAIDRVRGFIQSIPMKPKSTTAGVP
jgi:hypothetical protein